eukprot:TRINITY_DN4849_c1_g1_i4.p1 TRINITY_DN4849_c1_g1~~TRINITY_DN4849_c1_g1_i4.p1  ORF type:complete len:282 (+),score=-18.23 TRINITY_DN4849_c1_g1_i4:128-973(+)
MYLNVYVCVGKNTQQKTTRGKRCTKTCDKNFVHTCGVRTLLSLSHSTLCISCVYLKFFLHMFIVNIQQEKIYMMFVVTVESFNCLRTNKCFCNYYNDHITFGFFKIPIFGRTNTILQNTLNKILFNLLVFEITNDITYLFNEQLNKHMFQCKIANHFLEKFLRKVTQRVREHFLYGRLVFLGILAYEIQNLLFNFETCFVNTVKPRQQECWQAKNKNVKPFFKIRFLPQVLIIIRTFTQISQILSQIQANILNIEPKKFSQSLKIQLIIEVSLYLQNRFQN